MGRDDDIDFKGWRINRLANGTAQYRKEEGTDAIEDYSDKAFLEGDISWMVFGSAFERRRPK